MVKASRKYFMNYLFPSPNGRVTDNMVKTPLNLIIDIGLEDLSLDFI